LRSPDCLLQAALNGDRGKADHPATPVSVEELGRDASACVAAGARACGVPVGVTTSAEIEPDPERRLRLVGAWREPDHASVNLSEPGAMELMEVLVGMGVGVEAGVWTVEDAERLAASGLGARVTRILVEPVEASAEGAVGLVEDIHRVLDELGVAVPRLQHGDGETTWVLLTDAVRRGLDTRVGLEDTLVGPDGERASSNEALVRAACELGAGI
jgi:uncharacterized protein (DUF849 family)